MEEEEEDGEFTANEEDGKITLSVEHTGHTPATLMLDVRAMFSLNALKLNHLSVLFPS